MIIVTGGTSGLGRAIAEGLAADGRKVVTVSRSNSNLGLPHIKCDVSDYASLKSAKKNLLGFPLKPNALINCAGIASMNLALTTPPDVIERIISTNLLGTIYSCQVFGGLLLRQGNGRIINFSTIAVRLGLAGESIYVASKAGVEGFSRVLASELSGFGVTVNCIAPGPIPTQLLKGISKQQIDSIISKQLIKKRMEPDDVVQQVKLLLSEEARNITGQILALGGV